MSQYTTELRYLIEMGIDLGLSAYPIFDESYRDTLNNHITDYFYFREIGFETAALFTNRLRQRMNLIMPYYNQLYLSAKLELEPLTNYKLTEVFDGATTDTGNRTENTTRDINAEGESTSKLTGNATSTENTTGTQTIDSTDTTKTKQISSDTPQGMLSAAELAETSTWATNAQFVDTTHTQNSTNSTESEGKTESNTTSNGNDTSTSTTKDTYEGTTDHDNAGTNKYNKELSGYMGVSPSELLQKYRETFLNIDLMIIKELESLFMGVW